MNPIRFATAKVVIVRRLLMSVALAVSAVQIFASAVPQITQIAPPKRILFVGNSYTYYNNSLHGHLGALLSSADPKASGYVIRALTLSGGFLHEQVGLLSGMLASQKWDIVILQGQSLEAMKSDAARFDRFMAAARKGGSLIRSAGAEAVLFMTWAREDKPEMTASLAEGYVSAGNELGALVVPVGLAFERALKEAPTLALHQEDKSHPTVEGTYLASCVFYSALFRKSPVALSYHAGIDPSLAARLQEIAWRSVEGFYGGVWTPEKPNKAPEPTPGSVTPRATEPKSK